MNSKKNEEKIPFDELSSQERQAKYNSSPFFKKKNEETAAFLKKHPIPKQFIKNWFNNPPRPGLSLRILFKPFQGVVF